MPAVCSTKGSKRLLLAIWWWTISAIVDNISNMFGNFILMGTVCLGPGMMVHPLRSCASSFTLLYSYNFEVKVYARSGFTTPFCILIWPSSHVWLTLQICGHWIQVYAQHVPTDLLCEPLLLSCSQSLMVGDRFVTSSLMLHQDTVVEFVEDCTCPTLCMLNLCCVIFDLECFTCVIALPWEGNVNPHGHACVLMMGINGVWAVNISVVTGDMLPKILLPCVCWAFAVIFDLDCFISLLPRKARVPYPVLVVPFDHCSAPCWTKLLRWSSVCADCE